MPLTIQCGNCAARLRVEESHLGLQVKCPNCQTLIQLPAAAPTSESTISSTPAPLPAAPSPPQAAVPAAAPTEPPPPAASPQPAAGEFNFDTAASNSAVERAKGQKKRKKKTKAQSTAPAKKPESTGERPKVKTPVIVGAVGIVVCIIVGVAFLVGGDDETDEAQNVAAQDSTTVTDPAPTTPGDNDSHNPKETADPEPATPSGPLSVADLIERIDDGVVYLTVSDANGLPVAIGSGFLVDKSGLVATNYHVVEDAAQVKAQFKNGFEFEVRGYRAWDKKRDLAVVELAGMPFQSEVLPLNNDTLRQGADVVAVGHPRGFKFSTTSGIISGLFPTIELPDDVKAFLRAPSDQTWIQTNATIAGGSSGGPLLNMYGEVVGVNTWRTTDVGLGFASHVKHLKDLLAKLEPQAKPFAEVNDLDSGGAAGLMTPIAQLDPQVGETLVAFRRGMEEFEAKLLVAGTEEQRQQLLERESPAPAAARKLIDLAKADPASEKGFQALFYAAGIATEAAASAADKLIQESTGLLLQHHPKEERLGLVAVSLASTPAPAVHDFLRKLAGASPHEQVKGLSHLSLARALEMAEETYGEHDAEVIAALEKVVNDFGDVEWQGRSLRFVAEPDLFARRNLRISKPAPEIVGQELSGKTFKLSDYRGKTVLLLFTSELSPACQRLYPHVRIVAEKFAEQPFAVVGVSLDDYADLEESLNRKKITWRTWWDGAEHKIARKWNIEELPTLFVVDDKGIIRHRSTGNEDANALQTIVQNALTAAPSTTVASTTETPTPEPEPEPEKPKVTVPPADSADPQKDLLELGVRVVNSTVALVDDSKLSQALRDAPKLKNALTKATRELEQLQAESLQLRNALSTLRAQAVKLNAQLTAADPNNVAVYNKLVGAVNATQGQIELIETRQKAHSAKLKQARKEMIDAREAYLAKVLETRELADAVAQQYRTKAADAKVLGLLAQLGKQDSAEYELSPSRSFQSNLRKLKALEDAVLSETIELRKDGSGTLYVTVNIKDKHQHELVVDSGASLVVLPHKVAASYGLVPTANDPPLIMTLADGRQIPARLVIIPSLRVGKFTVDNVECAVLGEEATNAEPLLGMSFLGQFKFEIDAQAAELKMVKIDE